MRVEELSAISIQLSVYSCKEKTSYLVFKTAASMADS
jgi:hypothetical protein